MPKLRPLKILLFVLCSGPFLWLAWRFYNQDLTANPLEFLQHETGTWSLRFILTTLAVTPLRKLLQRPSLIRYRRMIGLFAFFYGSLHFFTYLYFDKLFDLAEISKDVFKRPFIFAGFTAFILILPLAITSTSGWIRRLGGKRWQALHRAIYVAGLAAVIHYYWLVKSDVRLPLMYAGIWAVLLAYRAVQWMLSRAKSPARQRTVSVAR